MQTPFFATSRNSQSIQKACLPLTPSLVEGGVQQRHPSLLAKWSMEQGKLTCCWISE